ncbi:MAG TPA: DUF3800 domain-containing protein [Rhodocyclaceae bacterium]|nr:DUF3800 domain-containing protein [Rhodocyclaceae bacterium]
MHLCYIDESGTSSIPGNTSHFILAGLTVPIWHWKDCDVAISNLKKKFRLEDAEIHTGWLIRPYSEQTKIPDFDRLSYQQRRSLVEQERKAELLRLQRSGKPERYKQAKKNYEKTTKYTHLTFPERRDFVRQVADCVGGWGFARLFAECIDKVHFDPSRHTYSLDEQAFDQIVSRFEQFLKQLVPGKPGQKNFGLLIHDNNDTVAKKHTLLMQKFHKNGTLWTGIDNIIETPLFVDSQLTSMVQIADVCAYALRRYLENSEPELFDLIFRRADRRGALIVGVRHFTNGNCSCKICFGHRIASHN